jgi:putative Mn2+ efflux pump MntP
MKDKPTLLALSFGGLLALSGTISAINGWVRSRKAPGAIEEGIHVRIHGVLLAIIGLLLIFNYFKRRREN